jgi:ActR/RegA family two-component response regulator
MMQPSSLFVVDADARSLETLTFGFEREGYRVTGTSDLKRAPLLVRSAPHDVAVVALREPEASWLEVVSAVHGVAQDLPIVVLGPQGMKPDALRAGAADFLTLPTFLRDVIGVGRLSTLGRGNQRNRENKDANGNGGADEIQTRLSEHYGLFYLLRAMASSERSGILSLTRGNRRAELRIHEGTVVSASVGAMQNLPALHHLLLWEEAALSLSRRAIPKRSQLHLSAQEILDECERFLRDFAHAARDLGSPRTLYVAAGEAAPAMRGLQQSQVTPLLRLFDGRRVLADVIEESPFRIFDTVRMIRRLRDGGALVVKPAEPGHERPDHRDARTGAPAGGRNGAAPSMLAEWAMVPDQRGVVGDRRNTSRRLRPIEPPASSPAPAPAPAPAAAPIPLTAKKAEKGATASGELAVAQRKPTPAAASTNLLAVAPTVQVQLDAAGVPLGAPLAPSDPAGFRSSQTPPPVRVRSGSGRHAPLDDAPAPRGDRTPAPVRVRSGSGRHAPLDDAPAPRGDRTPAPVRTRSGSGRHAPVDDAPPAKPEGRSSERTPRPRKVSGDGQSIAADDFDAVEADFFAREADLYKREALESFDDLDHPLAGLPGGRRKK